MANQSNVESDNNNNDKGYLLLLTHRGGDDGGGGDENEIKDNRYYSDVEFSDISQLNSTITILQRDTIKTHLRHMITNTHGSKTIENFLSRNGKRSSSFPNIFEKLTDCMMQNTIHSVTFSPSRCLDLSKHNSRIPSRDMYNKSGTKPESNDDYFLFGFSPETEILKNLIAVINVVSSLFVSGINILERDVRKRYDILCQPGHEIEYAQILRDVKQLNSISTATLNFMRNPPSTLSKACPCCRSKSHTRSPLIDAFESHDITSIINKRQNNILIPPELIFKGIQGVAKATTASSSTDIELQAKLKKSNKRIKSTIDQQIKNVLNNMHDTNYRRVYNKHTEMSTQALQLYNHGEIKENTIGNNLYSNNSITSGNSDNNNITISSLEPFQKKTTDDTSSSGSDGGGGGAAAAGQSPSKNYLVMRDGQQRHEIVNFVKFQ